MTILFVGKLSSGKGLGVLYQAAERVMAALPNARFVLVGSPGVGFTPPPPEIARVFSLTGRLDARDVADLMEHASVLVAPSVWPEPLSRVLLEAMHAELPIVATTVGGTPEALEHGSSAVLVPPDDADALAEGLLHLLRDPGYAAALAEGARRRFDHRFTPEAILPQILAVYDGARARH
jgi:glycosyltransferase involved in cell wall biosynthesis